jgi:hypothetical protein
MVSPANLFIENWEVAKSWNGVDVGGFTTPCTAIKKAINESLLIPDALKSYTALKNLQTGEASTVINGRIMCVLRAIDSFFEIIHPRTLAKPILLSRIPLNHWLREVDFDRVKKGAYSSTAPYNLIPRGPLYRSPRDDFATSAYSLNDQFSFLSVVRAELCIDDRPIHISTLVKNRSLGQGAGLSPSSNGSEKVAFIPVAQIDEHLEINCTDNNGQSYVDFKLHNNVDAASVIDSVLNEVVYADIVISAELMVSEDAADRLVSMIADRPGRSRILVAGSGNTRETKGGFPWNEARVISGDGVELWRQRKIWQAGLDASRTKDLNLVPGLNGQLMECNYAGGEVVVADIEGLGRCIVLICQDIHSTPLAPELLRQYQPDWVFVPILDWGAGVERWAHQKIFDLSCHSNARFLIASSLSLVEKLKKDNQPCGLAIGPRASTAEDQGRECEPAYVGHSPHGYGMVEWRTGWGKTTIGFQPSKEKIINNKSTH